MVRKLQVEFYDAEDRRQRGWLVGSMDDDWVVEDAAGALQRIPDALLSTPEAARYLGISPVTLRAWVKQGLIPRIELTKRVHRFSLNDMATFVKSRYKEATAGPLAEGYQRPIIGRPDPTRFRKI